jgi:hypothetical protein
MGAVQKNQDAAGRRELAQAARAIGGAVAGLLASMQVLSFAVSVHYLGHPPPPRTLRRLTMQAGSRGTQACINAITSIDGVVVDLETAALFASAGM